MNKKTKILLALVAIVLVWVCIVGVVYAAGSYSATYTSVNVAASSADGLGTYTTSGNGFTVTVAPAESAGTCGGTNYSPQSSSVTLTNKNAYRSTLNYTIATYETNKGSVDPTVGTKTAVLDPEGSVTIKFTSGSSSGNNASYKVTVNSNTIVPVTVSADSADTTMGTAEASPNGSISPGTDVTFTATAKTGYQFDYWKNSSGARVSTENPFSATATTDTTLTAVFKELATEVDLSVSILSDSYGTVTIDGNTVLSGMGGKQTVAVNTTHTLVASANEGYSFVGWLDGTYTDLGSAYLSGTPSGGATKTVNAEYNDLSYTAVFVRRNSYSVSVNDASKGAATVKVGSGAASSSSVVAALSQTVSYAASANSGYVFEGWFAGAQRVSTDANYSFTVMEEGDLQLQARFRDPQLSLALGPGLSSIGVNIGGSTQTITGAETFSVSNGTSVTLTANVASGYTFYQWQAGASSASTSVSYTFTMSGDKELTGFTKNSSGTVAGVCKNVSTGTIYATVEEAMAAATNGQVVVLIADAAVTQSFTIESGRTLLIPYGSETSAAYTSTSPSNTAMGSVNYTLTIPKDVTVTVKGTLFVNAKQGSQSTAYTGNIAGNYGKIVLDGNIVVSGSLHAYGIVSGSGTITAQSTADVHQFLEMTDYRGGSQASDIYKKMFPINQFYIQNIQTTTVYKYGSRLYGHWYLYVPSASMDFDDEEMLVGPSSNSRVFFSVTSGDIIWHYNASRAKTIVEIYGEAAVSRLKVSISALLLTVDMDTASVECPLSGAFDITVMNGATVNMANKFKMLPGGVVTVNEGGILNISSSLFLYDVADYQAATWNYGGYRMKPLTAGGGSISETDDGQLIVNGTVNVTSAGKIYSSSGAGNASSSIRTTSSSGRIVFGGAAAGTATVTECASNKSTVSANFDGARGKFAETGTWDKFAGNTTYYSNGDSWYRYKITYYNNGAIVGYDYTTGGNVTKDLSAFSGAGATIQGGTATASVSGSTLTLSGIGSDVAVNITGTVNTYAPTFVLNATQYSNYQTFTGDTLSDTVSIDGSTYYVVLAREAAAFGSTTVAPTNLAMGVSTANANSINWYLSDSRTGEEFSGIVPEGTTNGGPVYIYGIYTGAVAYNSFTGQLYGTLEDAFAALPGSGNATITMVNNCGAYVYEDPTLVYPVNTKGKVTFDLNGFTATGRITNGSNTNLTIELNGGTLDYHTGATAAASSYRTLAAVINSGTLTIQDTAGGGKITTDIASENGGANHAAVIRNNGGTVIIGAVNLEMTQMFNVNNAVVMNYNGGSMSINGATISSGYGYGVFNYGATISSISDVVMTGSYGINNRNLRGSNTIANGYNISKTGTITTINNCNISVGQYAIYNGGLITTVSNSTFMAAPDSAQVDTLENGSTARHGDVQCYTVFNSANWWYDTNVWKRTDTTAAPFTRTDVYKEDESCRPTIGTITNCNIYAENTSTSASYGYALVNYGVIGKIGGTTNIKTYKHPDSTATITTSHYAMHNLGGGIIKSIEGTVNISATGIGTVYNDGVFTTQNSYTYANKVGGNVTYQYSTYGEPSTIQSITCAGTWSCGSYYALMNSGYIGTINAPNLTLQGNTSSYNVLYNTSGGANSTYEYTCEYTDGATASTAYHRHASYTKNLTKGSTIDTLSGVTIIGKYQVLNNQGHIGTLSNVTVSNNASSNDPTFLNGDSRYATVIEDRKNVASYAEDYPHVTISAGYATRYYREYTYSTPTIDTIDNLTVTSNGQYAFRNAGSIGTLKNSSITATTSYALHNSAAGPFTEKTSVQYYSGTSVFATTKYTSEYPSHYKRNTATIGTIDNCTIKTNTSTYAALNIGHIGTIKNSTFQAGATTAAQYALANFNSREREYTRDCLDDVFYVTANGGTACTAYWSSGGETNTVVYDYDAPVIDLIGEGNTFIATTTVIANTGIITAIDSGEGTPTTITGSAAKGSTIYNYSACLDARTTTTPYTAAASAGANGTAGTAANSDTLLPGAQIGTIKNVYINANGYGILNGDATTGKTPTIGEIGAGTEIYAHCTTAGYHAIYNQANAKVSSITGGIFTTTKATTYAYGNNNTAEGYATVITGGDFKGTSATRDNAIFQPDNTSRQTYGTAEAPKVLSTNSRSVDFNNGTTVASGTGYYYIADAYTVTFDMQGHGIDSKPEDKTVESGQTITAPTAPAANAIVTEDGKFYRFDGWFKEAACTTAFDFTKAVTTDNFAVTDGTVTAYAKWTEIPPVAKIGETNYLTLADAVAAAQNGDTITMLADEALPGLVAIEGKSITLDLNGYTVYRDVGASAIQVKGTGTLTVKDSSDSQTGVVRATAAKAGESDAIVVLAGGSFTLESGTIRSNTYGISTLGTVTVTGGLVIGDTGALYKKAGTSGTFTVSGGWFSHAVNSAYCAAGYRPITDETHDPKYTVSNLYTVTFNANGHGTAPATQSVVYGGKATQPTAPTDNDYIFGGWYKEAACTNEWNFSTDTVTADTVIYAKWTANHVHNLTAHPAVPATCTEAGNSAYWSCEGEDGCGKYFSDAEGTNEIEEGSWVISATGHDYVAVVTAPTCTEAGYTTHTCSRCGDSYTDTLVAALGHSWEFVNITWSGFTATANYKCAHDASHTQTVTATVTSAVTTAATCEGTGVRTYTATVTAASSLDGAAHTGTTTEAIPATGHDWDEPTWTWTGTSAATATFTCKTDGSHTTTETATVTSTETSEKYTYTATVTLDGETYTDSKEVTRSYTVTFQKEDGTVLQTKQVAYGQTPSYTGATSYQDDWYTYTVSGWTPALTAVTGDATYTATYTSQAYKFYVTFSTAQGTAPEAQIVEFGDFAENPGTLTASGWIFGGWYKEAACTNTWDFDSEPILDTTTIYAKWTEKATPAATDFTVSGNTYTYDGTAETATVTGQSGMGAITVGYYQGETKVDEPTNAGAYDIWVSVTEGSAYKAATVQVGTLTISQKTATVTAANKSKTYGEADPALNANVTGLVAGESLDYTLSRVTGENAGTYTIAVALGNNPNYDVTATNGTFTINQKAITITADSDSKAYDGTALTKGTYTNSDALVGEDEITSVTVTGSQTVVGSSANVPSAAVIMNGEINVTANYNITYTNGTLEVTKAETNTVTVNITGWTYGDAANAPTSTATFGEATYYYKVKGADDSTYTTAVPTQAGEYTVSAYVDGTDNYPTGYATKDFAIAQKNLTITGLGASNKTYDGTTNATVTGTATLTGVVGEDDVTVTAGSASFASANVGEDIAVTFSGYGIDGDDAGNYRLSAQPAATTANITAKNVYITGLDASDKVYDGTTDATVTGTAALTGVIGEDDVSVTAGSAGFADANVGEGKTVTFSGYGIDGDDALNYVLAAQPAAKTADITPKTVTVTVNAQTKTYGEDDPTLTYTANGLLGSDTLTGALARVAGENVGTYAISQGTLAASDNYTISFTGANLTITPATMDVTVQAYVSAYDGAAHGITVTAPDGASVTYATTEDGEYSETNPTYTNVCNNTVYYKVEKDNYTTVTGESSVTIARKNISGATITLGDSLTYTGSEQTQTVASVVIDGLNATFTVSDNTGTNADAYTLAVTGTGNFTGTATADFTIAQAATNTVTVNITGWTYGDAANAPTSNATFGTATYTYSDVEDGAYTATVPSTAGTWYVKATVAGNDNYVGGQAVQSFTIAQKAITITADSDSKVYDGAALTKNSYTSSDDLVGEDAIDSVTVTGSQTDVGTSNNVPSEAVIKNGETDVTTNYAITYVNGTLRVTKASIDPSVSIESWTYGEAASEPSVTGNFGDGAVTYTYAIKDSDEFSATVPTAAGEYTVKAIVAASDNYNGGEAIADFTIAKRALTVTAGSDTKVYDGTALTKNTYSITSGSVATGDEITVTVSGSQTNVGTGSNVPSVVIMNGEDNVTANYAITRINGSLTVTAKAVTVTADDASKTYGASDPELTATVGGLLGDDTITYTVTRADGENVGEYTITASGDATQGNYSVTYETGTFTVNAKAVTVRATNTSKTYGEEDPELTATVTGLVGEDTITYTVVRAEGEDAGTYAITASGDSAQGNYTVTYVPGTFTINKATATVTAAAKTKAYGTADPELTATVTGLTNGDAAGVISYTLSREEGENVGSYTITPAGEAVQGNYDVVYETAALTITKASATVTADNKTKVYGEDDPELTASVTGLVGSDTISYTLSRAEGEDVDTYAITPAGNAVQGNYDVTYVSGLLTITKAGITPSVALEGWTYGDDPNTPVVSGNPGNGNVTITYSVKGENDFDSEVPTAAGEYTVKAVVAQTGNYSYGIATADFTISPKAVTVTADAKSKTYGATDPTLTATVDGLVGDDTLNYTLSRAEGEHVDEYAITVTPGENPNYSVTATSGTFTITKKAATVTAETKTKVYGDADPELTANETGLVGSDTLNYILTRAAGEDVDTYAITVILGENPNYSVTATNSTFTITKATATVTADAKSKTYGAADPELTATVTGLVGSETLNYTLARAEGEDVDTYAITVTLGENPNYNVTAANGTFTITQKAATVTADAKSKTYGEADPALTASVEGLVGSDTLNYTLARAAGEAAGTYDITATLGENPNYSVTAVNGTFTINAKAVTPTIVLSETEYTYDGEAKTPIVTLYDGETVIPDSEYTVSYDSNTDSGTATVTVTDKVGGNYSFEAVSAQFSIVNAGQDAPEGITGHDETIHSKADGRISGVDATMEYSSDGTNYTAITGTQITDLVPGTYYVRYAAKENFDVSTAVTITIAQGRYLTVIWVNEDGTELEKDEDLTYLAVPSYDGETPTKAVDAQYTYTFDKWTPDVAGVTADTTYTATYTSTVNNYTVTWKNEDGTVLETDENVPYGTTPSFDGETPTKDSTAQYHYVFAGWTPEVDAVTGDAEYTAVYTEQLRSYTITWLAEDGETIVDTTTVAYGDTPEFTGTLPEKADPEKGHWSFSWSPAVKAVTGDASYTATYKQAYWITINYDDTKGVVKKSNVVIQNGETVEYISGTFTFTGTPNRGYDITGWYPTGSETAFSTTQQLRLRAANVTDDLSYDMRFVALQAMDVQVTMPDAEAATATYNLQPIKGTWVNNTPLESGVLHLYEKDALTLKAPTVNSEYLFDYWLINGERQVTTTSYTISSNEMTAGSLTSIELVVHKKAENRSVTLHLPEAGVVGGNYEHYSNVSKSYVGGRQIAIPALTGDVVFDGLTEADTLSVNLSISSDYIINGFYRDAELTDQFNTTQSLRVTITPEENTEFWFSLTYDPYVDIPGYTPNEGLTVTARTIRERWSYDGEKLVPSNLTTNNSMAPMMVVPESDGYLYFEYYLVSTGTWEYGRSQMKVALTESNITNIIRTTGAIGDYNYDKTGTWTAEFFPVTAGQTVGIVMTQDNDNGELDGGIRNLRLLTEDPTIIVTSNNTSYGTASSTGITENKATLGSTVTLTANPAEGYSFYAWVDKDSGDILSEDAEYSFTATLNRNIEGQFFPYVEDPVAKVGNVGFANLEDAIALAQASSGTAVLVKDYTQTQSLTIPANVTLLIPYDVDVTEDHSTMPTITWNVNYVNPTAYKTLTLASGATLTVNGKMVVDSKISAKGQSPTPNGAPTGPYGKVIIDQGGSIVVKSGGSLTAWGFITAENASSLSAMNSSGTAAVTVESGATVYEPFQIMDWPGGSNIYGIFMPMLMGGEFTGIFPFSQYYVQNIEVPMVLQSGCTEQIFGCAYMSMNLYIPEEFVGANGLFQLNSGYLRRTYDANSDRTTYDVYGNMNLSSIVVPSPMASMVPDIPSTLFTLPLTGNLSIKIHTGTTNILEEQNLSLQPGLEFVVDEGATLNLPNTSYLLDAEDYVGKGAVFSNRDLVQVKYVAVNAGAPATRTQADAMIDINGTVNVSGALYTSASGANITSSGGTGTVVLTSAPPDAATTTYASNAGAQVEITVVPARLRNIDDSFTETYQAAAGTTFYYANGYWVTGFELVYDDNLTEEEIEVPETTVYPLGEEITIAENLDREGYVVASWNTEAEPDEENPGTAYEPGSVVTVTREMGRGTTLYAQWKKLLTNEDITAACAATDYNGETQVPVITVTDGETVLTEGTDYTVILPEGRLNAGDYDVVIEGIGEYAGSRTVAFTINPISTTVTIAGASSTTDYDGEAHTVSGYTATASTTLYDVDHDFTFSGNATATRTDAGTTNMGLAAEQFTNTNTNFATVTFEVTDGYQTITPIDVTVTIVGNSNTATYNGSEHSVSGYTATADSELYDVDNDFTFSGMAEAAQTDVGTAVMGLAAEQFTNTNTNFATVTFNVTGGYQTITPKAVTVKADDATKVYGESDPTLAATVTGTVGSETVAYTVTRETGENVGSYTITVAGEAEQGNYAVTYETGTFTITAAPMTVEAEGYTGTYDAEAHSITVTAPEGAEVTYSEDGETYSATAPTYTNVGNHTVYYKVTKANFADVTGNETVVIEPKAVTVKAAAASKGIGMDDPEFTATVTGTLNDDEITYTLSREAGEEPGTYTITPAGEALQGNYSVTYTSAKLTIGVIEYTTTAGKVSYLTAFPSAFSNGTYKLLTDVTRTARMTPGALASSVTLDLNGHTLTSTASDYGIILSRTGSESSPKIFQIISSAAGGKLTTSESASAAIQIQGKYNNVTIGENVTVEGCVTVLSDHDTLDVYGTIDGRSDFAIAENGSQTSNATINIYDGAVLSSDIVAVYLPGGGTTNITGGSITGTTAVYAKSGTLNISGGMLTGTGVANAYNPAGGAVYATGDALVVDSCGYPNGAPVVSVTGGTFVSQNADAIASYASEGNTVVESFVSDGEFNTSLDAALVVEGKLCTTTLTNANGYYYIVDAVTVTFEADGETYATVTLPEGETVSAPTAPTKTGYTFRAWQLSGADYDFTTAVTEDVTLTADWTINYYTITWLNDDGSEIDTTSVAYGETPTHDDPAKAATAQYTYTFTGWTPEIEAVTREATYTATYSSTVNEYTIIFVDEDGTELQSGNITYGETPAYTGETPTKADTADYHYDFVGWTPEIAEVTGEATYTATYSETARTYGEPVWTWDGTESATATFTTNDGFTEFTLTEDAAITHETTTAETCETDGVETYTATVTFRSTAYTDQTTEIRAALGHDYTYYYIWNTDNTSVIARRVCQNDHSHTDYERVATTSEVTKVATCEEEGEITYTATFTAEYFETQTKVVATPKTHTYEPVWVWLDSETAYVEVRCSNCNDLLTRIAADITETITKEATCTEAGEKTYTATAVYNGETLTDTWSETVIIPATGHTLTEHEATTATCETAGNSAYWSCDTCGKYFSDAEGTTEIDADSWIIPATGHVWGDPTYTYDEDEGTVAAARVCENDPSHIEAETTNQITESVATEPTCTEAGSKTLTAVFENEAFSWTTTASIPATGHTLTAHEAATATCETAGNSAYWSCEACGKYFSDSEGTTEIEADSWIIPATGHSFGEPTWSWTGNDEDGYTAATATFTCSVCGHEETVTDGDLDYIVSIEATESAPGTGVYTAAVTFDESTFTDTKEVSIAYIKLDYPNFTIVGVINGFRPEDKENIVNITDTVAGTFTVTYDKACVVAVKTTEIVDGEEVEVYTRLHCTAVEGEENTYAYDLSELDYSFTSDVEIVVAVKGDVNGDGLVKNQDVTLAKAAIAGKRTLSNLQMLVADVTGDGNLKNQDITQIKAFIAEKTNLKWDLAS